MTNGFRAMWAAEYEAAVHTLVDTAALKGAAPFHAILQTIAACSIVPPETEAPTSGVGKYTKGTDDAMANLHR